MSQAPRRPLRRRYLLLLVPWLLASTPAFLSPPARAEGPEQIVFVQGPGAFKAGTCRSVVLEVQSLLNLPVPLPSVLTLSLSSSHAPGTFHETSACDKAVTSVSMGLLETRKTVWYRDTLTGPVVLKASDGLLGLNDAETDDGHVLPAELDKFQLDFPLNATAWKASPLTVTALDTYGNRKTDYTGRVETALSDKASGAGVLPESHEFTVGSDGNNGQAVFLARFVTPGSQSITVQDTFNASASGVLGGIVVQTITAASFRFIQGPPSEVKAGTQVSFRVQALDGDGNPSRLYTGPVAFSSTDPRAVVISNSPFEFGEMEVIVRFGTPGTWSLTVREAKTEPPIAEGVTTGIRVVAGPLAGFELTSPTDPPISACERVVLNVRAVDALKNTVPVAARVRLCANADSAATILDENLGSDERDGTCIHGNLSSEGTGQVVWFNPSAQPVTFGVRSVLASEDSSTLQVTWGSARFSPLRSQLSFRDTDDAEPSLRTLTGQVILRFEPRDTCGAPVALPDTVELAFDGEAPLRVLNPPLEESDGRWKVFVRLDVCPDTEEEPLALWPLLNQQPVLDLDGVRLQRRIRPLCLPPDAQISIRPEPEGVMAAPGALVDFVVEVENTGSEAFAAGLLALRPDGLDVLRLSLDGQPLELLDGGVKLPRLEPESELLLQGQAQASLQPEAPARVTVWYATAEGMALTEEKTLEVDREGLGVDVGCGCHTGSLSSQLLPLLALLGATSRSWRRSRRLRRGERTDRQAPCP